MPSIDPGKTSEGLFMLDLPKNELIKTWLICNDQK